MKKFRKTLLIAGISSFMLCTTAFATENNIVASDINIQENSQTEIQNETTVTQGTVLANILNVRSGPSTDTEILGKLPLGSVIDVTSNNDGWYQIEFDSKIAFVFGEYISVIDNSVTGELPADSSVVEYAKKYLGVQYIYGGNTPSGFDCSGFVQYVMANFGITMPHSSTDQYSIGIRVDKSQLMAGDLVFFKYTSGSRLNHVGIYVGDGNFIHSPIPGQSVKIDTLASGYFATYYYGATRVIN